MARYFFHLDDPSGVLRDDTGEEFGNVEEVRRHANHVARELWRNRPNHVAAGQRLLVMDADGATLYRIPFISSWICDLVHR